MREKIIEFFSNKFNLILTIVQVIALVLFGFGNVWAICFVLAISSEGVFFVVLGIKTFANNKQIKSRESMMGALPIKKAELEHMQKQNNRTIKLNKLQAVLYIIMGIILVFIGFF